MIPTIINSLIGGVGGEVILSEQEKYNKKPIFIYLSFVLTGLSIIFLIIYFLILDVYSVQILHLNDNNLLLFKNLSLVYIVNAIFSVNVSLLQPQIFYHKLFKYYLFRILFIETFSLLLIIIFYNSFGIIIFSISVALSSILTFLSYSIKLKLSYFSFNIINSHKHFYKYIKTTLKKIFILSSQNIFVQLVSLIERNFALVFLNTGVLTAYIFSKNLYELPSTVFISTFLTSIYLEQVRLKQDSRAFNSFNKKILNFLLEFSLIIQILLILISPTLVLLFYKYGKFNDENFIITSKFTILLNCSIFINILFNFFTRTIMLLDRAKVLLFINFIRFIITLIILYILKEFDNSLPFSFIISYGISFLLIFVFIKPEFLRLNKMIFNLIILTFLSFLLYLILIPNLNLFLLNKYYSYLYLVLVTTIAIFILLLILRKYSAVDQIFKNIIGKKLVRN